MKLKKINFNFKTKKIGKKLAQILAIGLLAGTVITILIAGVNAWFDKHYFQFHQPIKIDLHAPITIEDREPLLSPLPEEASKSGMIETKTHAYAIPKGESRTDKLYNHIHLRESTRGQNPEGLHKTCEAKGMWNELGYLPKPGFCFGNEGEGRITVQRWLQKYINAGWSDNEILCYYNTGIKNLNTCSYVR